MYAILKHILNNFSTFTQPSFGAIKPALTRLEKTNFICSRKVMSDGGKLSVFYSITQTGRAEFKRLILEKISNNPLQFKSVVGIKLSCASYLTLDEQKKLFIQLSSKAQEHKFGVEKKLNDGQSLTFYQRIILDNTIIEYKNLIILIENLKKIENA